MSNEFEAQDRTVRHWASVVRRLVSAGYRDPVELHRLVTGVFLQAGTETVEALRSDDADVIVAHYVGLSAVHVAELVTAATTEHVMRMINGRDIDPPQRPQYAVAAEALCGASAARSSRYPVPRRVPLAHVDPPWRVATFAPASMGWRMGGGQDHMERWQALMAQMSVTERAEHVDRFDAPDEWRDWVRRIGLLDN